MPDIEKLRRFALSAALALILYSAAGISLEAGAKASVFGIPFIIGNPNLLLIGFVLASMYGLVRYFYYAIMLCDTPHRKRKDILHKLHAEGGHGNYMGSVFLGPRKYSTTPMVAERNKVSEQLENIVKVFPKVGNQRVIGDITSERFENGNGDAASFYQAEVEIPVLCRLAALLQDIDYTAPVWANLLALAFVIMN